MTNPLIALGPDSTDRLYDLKLANLSATDCPPPVCPPPVSTDADAKPRATVGAGIPVEAIAGTTNALLAVIRQNPLGNFAVLYDAIYAERRAWLDLLNAERMKR